MKKYTKVDKPTTKKKSSYWKKLLSNLNYVIPIQDSLKQIYIYAKSLQSCPTLCNPVDGSPPGSPVPGILQARTLEWVAISFSNAWKWKVKVKSFSHIWLLATHRLQPTRLLHPWDFPGKSTGVGCHCLLQYICIYILLNILLLLYKTCFYKTLANTRKLSSEWQSINKAETYL